ncbi:MAG: hypothetical protein LBQ95_06420 [Lachnospiraceae bacterium]|jgi:pimeloyl-ACP methyl ester carboxylesterase|nr:hypothetical protein [Lachnospiraceae bacterium]
MKNYLPLLRYEPVTHKRIPDPSEEPELDYDEEAYWNSEIGKRHTEMLSLFKSYPDSPMDPAVVNYWKAIGLKKELFDNDRDDGMFSYSVFTPIDIKPDKKYALIYFSHGGGVFNNLAETYGFNTQAAAEKYIIVYPNNGGRSNNNVDEEFDRIIKEIKKKGYPIDPERIYCVGFSSGSDASAVAACTYPEQVAAVGILPGGQPFKDLKFYTGSDYYASTKGFRIPGIFVGGSVDIASYPAPWVLDHERKPHRAENLNLWMRDIAQLKNYTPLTLESIEEKLRNPADEFEKEFGLSFDKTFSFHVQGVDWIGGDYYGQDDVVVMRLIRAIGLPHVVWESQANIVWDYIKHFRRDQNTGESIYDTVACWGER